MGLLVCLAGEVTCNRLCLRAVLLSLLGKVLGGWVVGSGLSEVSRGVDRVGSGLFGLVEEG